MLRLDTAETLLKKGANPNHPLESSGNTLGHELIPLYPNHREIVAKFILALLKYKADFFIRNNEGKTVLEAAKNKGLNLEDCIGLYQVFEKEESAIGEDDDKEDKESLTTLNALTKMGDNASDGY